MENLSILISVVVVVVSMVAFFLGMRSMIKELQSSVSDLRSAIKSSIEDVRQTIKDVREQGTKEHQALLDTAKEIQKSMQDEHKDMIRLAGSTNEKLVHISAELGSHIHEERKRT